MSVAPDSAANVKQAIPFFFVTDMEASLRFYVDGLGFRMTHSWVDDDGKARWCMLVIGEAALMLQEYRKERVPAEKLGVGVSICFLCEDAIAFYREVTGRGIAAARPFVGNAMWVVSLSDPDGYRLDFESKTDVPEETQW